MCLRNERTQGLTKPEIGVKLVLQALRPLGYIGTWEPEDDEDDSEEEVIDWIVAYSEEEEDTATTATPPQEVLHAAGQLATWSSAGPPGLTIAPKETRRSQPKAAPQLRVTEPQKPRLLQVALNQVRKQQ